MRAEARCFAALGEFQAGQPNSAISGMPFQGIPEQAQPIEVVPNELEFRRKLRQHPGQSARIPSKATALR